MTINRTNLEHAGYALVIQLAVALALFACLTLFDKIPAVAAWCVMVGGAAATAWFISREHTQREVLIAAERKCKIGDLEGWEGFTGWSLDAVLDAAAPMVSSAFVTALFLFR